MTQKQSHLRHLQSIPLAFDWSLIVDKRTPPHQSDQLRVVFLIFLFLSIIREHQMDVRVEIRSQYMK